MTKRREGRVETVKGEGTEKERGERERERGAEGEIERLSKC